MHPVRIAAAIGLATASLSIAHAEPVFGITAQGVLGNPALVSFDSATPGAMTVVTTISGVVAGQTIRGIDFRPANGLAYVVSSGTTAGQLYTLNLATGALTTVGSGFTLAGATNTELSIDFNPVVDRLRVVTATGQNYRVNPNDGTLVLRDTDLPGQNTGNEIAGVAYTNNFAGAATTTLYAYNFGTDQIDTIGSVNGTPTSPNSGQLFVVGDSGLLANSTNIGFDISGVTSVAYASVFDAVRGNYGFYTVNLASGAATLVGTEAFALLDFSVRTRAVAAVPEPDVLALVGLGALAFALRRRRRG